MNRSVETIVHGVSFSNRMYPQNILRNQILNYVFCFKMSSAWNQHNSLDILFTITIGGNFPIKETIDSKK